MLFVGDDAASVKVIVVGYTSVVMVVAEAEVVIIVGVKLHSKMSMHVVLVLLYWKCFHFRMLIYEYGVAGQKIDGLFVGDSWTIVILFFVADVCW